MRATLENSPPKASNNGTLRQLRIAIVDSGKSALKRLLYAGGVLSRYHHLRNRSVLTVAMFHRVLVPEDPRWEDAAAEWTLSSKVFESCLEFFEKHYTIVSLHDVRSALLAGGSLPPRSLLLTFDDGYADNEEYALPILRRRGLPAVVFVASDFIEQKRRPWTEDFLEQYLRGGIEADQIRALHALVGGSEASAPGDTLAQVWDIVQRGPRLSERDAKIVDSCLRKPLTRTSEPAHMLKAKQIRNLFRNGVAVAAHGKTHCAFPAAPDIAAELGEPRRVLQDVLGLDSEDAIFAVSFPHGAHTTEIVDRAVQEGYQLMFTTREELAPLAHRKLTTPLIGRINVSGPAFAPHGRLRPDLLAFHFFRRPHAGRDGYARHAVRGDA